MYLLNMYYSNIFCVLMTNNADTSLSLYHLKKRYRKCNDKVQKNHGRLQQLHLLLCCLGFWLDFVVTAILHRPCSKMEQD